jgi:hypothetical protein
MSVSGQVVRIDVYLRGRVGMGSKEVLRRLRCVTLLRTRSETRPPLLEVAAQRRSIVSVLVVEKFLPAFEGNCPRPRQLCAAVRIESLAPPLKVGEAAGRHTCHTDARTLRRLDARCLTRVPLLEVGPA